MLPFAYLYLNLYSNTTLSDKKLSRNYASYECGAKVIASNTDAQGTSNILSESKDEYMLNPCKSKIWFVIELCEPIQPSSLELANFELFSSTPKDLVILGSDRFPTRDWKTLGTYIAADERNIQHFDIAAQPDFLKFIKVEMQSHYGSEHFCPLSLVRAFGTSLVEEFDAIESGGTNNDATNDEDLDGLELGLIEDPLDKSRNLFGSAREAVISMIRKTAMVLKGSSDEAINDSVIAKQFMIHQKAFTVMSKVEPILKRFDCIKFSRNFSESNSTEVSRPCLYVESVLGLQLYQVLCDELLRLPSLRFKCDINSVDCKVKVTPNQPDPTNGTPSKFETQQPLKVVHESASIITDHQDARVKSTNIISPTATVGEVTSSSGNSDSTSSSSLDVAPTEVTSESPAAADKTEPSSTPSSSTAPQVQIDPSVTIEPVVNTSSSDSIVTESVQNSDTVTQQAPIINILAASGIQSPTPTSAPVTPAPVIVQVVPAPSVGNGVINGAILPASVSKESIFIKLNNRIKTLELNMTTNSQALEELRSRYREQMQEIQLAFNITEEKLRELQETSLVTDTSRLIVIRGLQLQLEDMTEKVNLLVSEKEYFHWQLVQVHILLMLVEIIVIIIIASYYLRKMTRVASEDIRSRGLQRELSTLRIVPVKRPSPFEGQGHNVFERDSHSPAKNKRLDNHNNGNWLKLIVINYFTN